MRRIHSTALLVATPLMALACGDSPAGPETTTAGVSFDVDGSARTVAGEPRPNADGSILDDEFAIARADSVAGFAVISFEPTGDDTGNLFVLQAPRQTGTYTCGDTQPCHGRYFTGVRNLDTVSADRHYSVTEGIFVVTQIGPDRVTGSFQLTLSASDGSGDTLVVDEGTVDVPYSASEVTDGSLACLLSLVGVGQGTCRA
jgi:hypothetical protein